MSVLVKKIALHTILPLIIGLVIYIIARRDTWLVQKLLPFRFSFIENSRGLSTGWLAKFVVYSGPDFCWNYSITSALLYWKYYSAVKNPYFPAIIFILVFMQEFVQLLLSAHFTFDIWDVVAAGSAFLLSLCLNREYV
jgi:hypothetical protein